MNNNDEVGCSDEGCPFYGTPHSHGKVSNEVQYGSLVDPTAATRHTGKWLRETEAHVDSTLTQEVPSDVAFNVGNTDVERTAGVLVQNGTALQVVEKIMERFGLKLVRTESAEQIIELQSLHGALYFREFYERDDDGNVTFISKPVTTIPGWVVAFEESRRPKEAPPTCYVCGEIIKPGELVQPHRHPISGAPLVKHQDDCML